MSAILKILSAARPMISVVTITHVSQAVPLAQALVDAGLPTIEVTLRTPAGIEGIRAIAAEVEGAFVGAGTVLTPTDLKSAAAAGATFAVSPGSSPALLAAGRDSAIPYLPAIATPSELMVGLDYDYRAFKLFPANIVGGLAMLKALGAPFPHVKFCPTGGIDLKNAGDFLALPNVACVGGSWTVPSSAVAARDWSTIANIARKTFAALIPAEPPEVS